MRKFMLLFLGKCTKFISSSLRMKPRFKTWCRLKWIIKNLPSCISGILKRPNWKAFQNLYNVGLDKICWNFLPQCTLLPQKSIGIKSYAHVYPNSHLYLWLSLSCRFTILNYNMVPIALKITIHFLQCWYSDLSWTRTVIGISISFLFSH